MEIQETRRYILEILKQKGDSTIDEIVEALSIRLQRRITTVTVRHHLERLRAEGLVGSPEIRRRNTPGRPQYVYSLEEKAYEYFPNNYANFTTNLLIQLKLELTPPDLNKLLKGVAERMAIEAGIPSDMSLPKRLVRIVDYLNQLGYIADWEEADEGYLLIASNCPYERVTCQHEEMCSFDLQLLTSLLGEKPHRKNNIAKGKSTCLYFIEDKRIPKS